MKSSSIIVAALLVTGFTVFGCSSSPSAQGDTGWATLFDGSSLDNWNQIGNANWRLPAILDRRLPHLNLEDSSEPTDAREDATEGTGELRPVNRT